MRRSRLGWQGCGDPVPLILAAFGVCSSGCCEVKRTRAFDSLHGAHSLAFWSVVTYTRRSIGNQECVLSETLFTHGSAETNACPNQASEEVDRLHAWPKSLKALVRVKDDAFHVKEHEFHGRTWRLQAKDGHACNLITFLTELSNEVDAQVSEHPPRSSVQSGRWSSSSHSHPWPVAPGSCPEVRAP